MDKFCSRQLFGLFPRVGLVLTLLLVACHSDSDAVGAHSAAAVPVDVVAVRRHSVTLTTELPGRVVAYRTAQVRPQVGGVIEKRTFEEGGIVKAGQQLYQIDPLRYRADVQTASANLDKAKANLAMATAKQKRYSSLLADKAVSKQDFDEAQAAYQQAQAGVEQAGAALKTAQINLQYTQVNAPISGRIGKSEVTEGALVVAQQAAVLATINQLDPIYVDVSQASSRLLELRKQMLNGSVSTDQRAKVHLLLDDGSTYEREGELLFSEMSVDTSTGTVSMRARFPNPDHILLPGMFVQATVEEGVKQDALLVPQRAVMRDAKGEATAMVVAADNKAELRVLNAGRAVAGDWLVIDGLKEGDKVIVAGLQKIRPGVLVAPTEVKIGGEGE